MRLAVILVHYHTPELAAAAVEALRTDLAGTGAEVEWRLGDNGSDEGRRAPLPGLAPGRVAPGADRSGDEPRLCRRGQPGGGAVHRRGDGADEPRRDRPTRLRAGPARRLGRRRRRGRPPLLVGPRPAPAPAPLRGPCPARGAGAGPGGEEPGVGRAGPAPLAAARPAALGGAGAAAELLPER